MGSEDTQIAQKVQQSTAVLFELRKLLLSTAAEVAQSGPESDLNRAAGGQSAPPARPDSDARLAQLSQILSSLKSTLASAQEASDNQRAQIAASDADSGGSAELMALIAERDSLRTRVEEKNLVVKSLMDHLRSIQKDLIVFSHKG